MNQIIKEYISEENVVVRNKGLWQYVFYTKVEEFKLSFKNMNAANSHFKWEWLESPSACKVEGYLSYLGKKTGGP